MNRKRYIQIALSVLAIAAAIPGAHRAAVKLEAYELIWLIPFLPAFTITFFWIVIVMVENFISADSYKNPRAIDQARKFLIFFDWLFLTVIALFICAGGVLFSYFA